MGPKQEQENVVDSTELDRMREYYWRKGIPSIVLAIVTLLLAGYSDWIVQPNIQDRYNRIVETNLNALGLASDDATTSNTLEAIATSGETGEDRELRRQKLEETHLCLRRQIIWNNQDDLPRYRTGLVNAALADWYFEEARRISTDSATGSDTIANIRNAISRARAERQKGMEAMRAAAKIGGRNASRASLWMVQNQISEKPELTLEELTILEETVRSLIHPQETYSASTSEQSALKALLAQLLVRSSLSPQNSQEVRIRRDRLIESVSLVSSQMLHDVTHVRWLAEATLATQPVDAKQLAWQGTQSFWAKQYDSKLSIDTIAAAFECMLIGGSFKEAQAFLAERLPGIPAFEQTELRSRTSDACVRMLMATSIRQLDGEASKDPKIPAVLTLAIQLQPDSSGVISLLESIATNANADSVAVTLSELIEADGDPGLRSLLNTIRYASVPSAETKPVDAQVSVVSEFENNVAKQPVFGIVASKIAIRQSSKQPIQLERWTLILSRVTEVAPDLLVVWSDLASLHLSRSQTDEAIRCLEYLQEKLPDNQDILEAIARAKDRLLKP